MPFVVTETTIRADGAMHRAMVVTPKAPMIYGVEKLARLRETAHGQLSAPDRHLIDEVAQRGVHVAVLRAADDDERRLWAFDAALTDAEVEELGYRLTLALLPIHRRMLHRGVALMAHTEWGTRECYAMRYGVRKAAEEFTEKQNSGDGVAKVDAWILRNMLFHFALSVDHVTRRLLPGHVKMIERRWERLKELTAHLPPGMVD